MSFVSDFGKKISNKTKEISQKAKVMSETNSLNNIIKGEECKIDFQYKTIGKLYFEKFGENPEDDFAEAIETIKASMQKIDETKQEITKIRSRFNCPECGEPFKNDALFCSKCGAKLPEKEEEAKVPADAKKCEKCGNLLKKDALFCNLCGNKLDVPEITAVAEESGELSEKTAVEEFAPVQPESDETVAEASETEVKAVETETTEETTVEEITEEAEAVAEQEEAVISETPVEETASDDEEPAEKICPNCNNKMLMDDIFCNECGTKVE
ncbi:MAG: zinc ribbon domain-containing protein [Oscillospiraceae bacterium]|nr:zinc ribbon domain-containing protein [Oscillospiraceae bacterium]